jgi:polysaccharide biosynthesis/export protein
VQRLIASPNENIYVRPGDTILAVRQQRHFLAFGASGRNGQIPFELDTLSVAEGVAKAGGLLDDRAEPGMVLLYRQESRKRVERYGVDISGFSGDNLPVLYRFDLRDPAGFVLARNFPMTDKDIIYVANAASVDFLKAVAVIRGVTGIVRDVDAVRRGTSGLTN